MITPSALTVTQVNTYIKSLIDEDINLNAVIISGEISNFKNHYRTGHFYLTLKDEKSSIKAVMFSTANRSQVLHESTKCRKKQMKSA
jgi:exodeoxyribonuclease VII large subunit